MPIEAPLRDYATLADAQVGIATWIRFYNERRPHQALDNRTPMNVYRGRQVTPPIVRNIVRYDHANLALPRAQRIGP